MKDRRRTSGHAFLRYLCVGAACFCLNWVLMLLIDRDRYVLSSAICFVTIGTFAYICHAVWTFQAPVNRRGLVSYLLGSAPAYPASLALIALFHDVMSFELRWALPAVTLVMLGVNFSVARITCLQHSLRRRSRLQPTSDV